MYDDGSVWPVPYTGIRNARRQLYFRIFKVFVDRSIWIESKLAICIADTFGSVVGRYYYIFTCPILVSKSCSDSLNLPDWP